MRVAARHPTVRCRRWVTFRHRNSWPKPQSNRNLLHLVEVHLVAPAIVELSCAGRGVVRHGSGIFERVASASASSRRRALASASTCSTWRRRSSAFRFAAISFAGSEQADTAKTTSASPTNFSAFHTVNEPLSQSLIPIPPDQNPCAHRRSPMDMILQG
jgi:hypothetical protein